MRWALFFCALIISVGVAKADTTALLWRDALNKEVLHGQLILEAPEGVAQVESASKFYQICHLREAADAVEMLTAEAKRRNRTPELIVIVDGPRDDWEELIELKNRLARKGIRLQLANSLISIDKVKGLEGVSDNPKQNSVKRWSAGTKPEAPQAPKAPTAQTLSVESISIPVEGGYWINTKSKIRHNKECRYYGKGKNGSPCDKDEGKACKVCGG